MPNPRPLKATASTLKQAGLAGGLLVQCLCIEDPRVQRAYGEWCKRHGLTPGVPFVSAANFQSVQRDNALDLALIEDLVHDELHLPYRWLAPLLRLQWALTFKPDNPDARVALDFPDVVGLPPGYAAKNQGQHLARDVDWFYRAKVKVPPETARALAKAYQARKRDRDDVRVQINHSVVQAGIARAERLFAVLVVKGQPDETI